MHKNNWPKKDVTRLPYLSFITFVTRTLVLSGCCVTVRYRVKMLWLIKHTEIVIYFGKVKVNLT